MPSTGTLAVKIAGLAAGDWPSGHRGRAAGQDDALGVELLDGGLVDRLEGLDLAVHARFAHAPGNQLGNLGTEIDDQRRVGHGGI